MMVHGLANVKISKWFTSCFDVRYKHGSFCIQNYWQSNSTL